MSTATIVSDRDDDRLSAAQLAEYLARIRLNGAVTASPDIQLLATVVKAQLSSIPYENLDLHYQRLDGPSSVCSIRLPGTFDKMVRSKRGGYCLELNTLLAQALRALGYGVVVAQSRIVYSASGPSVTDDAAVANAWPTHMLLLVTTVDSSRYLVDVGLAKYSLAEPLLLKLGGGIARGILGKKYRLRTSSHDPDRCDGAAVPAYMLQVSLPRRSTSSSVGGAAAVQEQKWADYYHFADRPVGASGQEFVHTWMSKGPHSVTPQCPFVTMPVTGVGQVSLTDTQLAIRSVAREGGGGEGGEDGYLFLEDGAETKVSKETLDGLDAVNQAMEKYFGVSTAYCEPPRQRVAVDMRGIVW